MVDKDLERSCSFALFPRGRVRCHRARSRQVLPDKHPSPSRSVLAAAAACAQYPGQNPRRPRDTPDLRAIAVLEWTGDEGKPKTSRLVPITVYDGQALQDGNVYLARPQPLALGNEVEYELEKNGTAYRPLRHQECRPGAGLVGRLRCMEAAAIRQNRRSQARSWMTASMPMTTSQSCIANMRQLRKQPGLRHPVRRRSAPSDPDRPTLHKKTGTDDSTTSQLQHQPCARSQTARPFTRRTPTTASSSTESRRSDRPVLHKNASAGNCRFERRRAPRQHRS